MTQRQRLSELYNGLAELYGDLSATYASIATELSGDPVAPAPTEQAPATHLQPLPAQKPQVYAPPPPVAPAATVLTAVEAGDIDISKVCPKHLSEYRIGRYGAFCSHKSDDPAFADRNGFCNLPGRDANRALAWVAIQKGAR